MVEKSENFSCPAATCIIKEYLYCELENSKYELFQIFFYGFTSQYILNFNQMSEYLENYCKPFTNTP